MVCPQTTHCAILLSLLGRRESVTEYSAPQWGQKKVPPSGTGPNRGTSAPPYAPNQYAPQREQIPAPSSRPMRNYVPRAGLNSAVGRFKSTARLPASSGGPALLAKSSTARIRLKTFPLLWAACLDCFAGRRRSYAYIEDRSGSG